MRAERRQDLRLGSRPRFSELNYDNRGVAYRIKLPLIKKKKIRETYRVLSDLSA